MSQTVTEYVQRTEHGGWRVADSRVSLDSIVHAYWVGKSPEAIADEFRLLSAEQVYGAIAFYLRHKAEIEHYLSTQDAAWQELAADSERRNGTLLNRLRQARGTE